MGNAVCMCPFFHGLLYVLRGYLIWRFLRVLCWMWSEFCSFCARNVIGCDYLFVYFGDSKLANAVCALHVYSAIATYPPFSRIFFLRFPTSHMAIHFDILASGW